MALRQLNRYDEALDAFNEALEIEPDNGPIVKAYADTLCLMGCREEAVPVFQRCLSIRPGAKLILIKLFKLLRNLNRHEEALPYINELIALAPKNCQYLWDRAFILTFLDHKEELLKTFDQIIAINPEEREAIETREHVLKAMAAKEASGEEDKSSHSPAMFKPAPKESTQAQLDLQDKLVISCEEGKLDAVKELVEKQEADPSLASRDGRLPLSAAIWSLNLELVEYLESKIPEINNEYWQKCAEQNKAWIGLTVPRLLHGNWEDYAFDEWEIEGNDILGPKARDLCLQPQGKQIEEAVKEIFIATRESGNTKLIGQALIRANEHYSVQIRDCSEPKYYQEYKEVVAFHKRILANLDRNRLCLNEGWNEILRYRDAMSAKLSQHGISMDLSPVPSVKR